MLPLSVTVDHAKVAEDLTDFPLYVDLAALPDLFWSTVAEGGGDIRCYAGDESELAREVVSCNITARTGELYVKVDLSSTADTVVFIAVDGQSPDYEPTDTYGRNAVWSDYAYVSHDGGVTDSGPNGYTSVTTSVTTTVGLIGDAASFNASDAGIVIAGLNPLQGTLQMSVNIATIGNGDSAPTLLQSGIVFFGVNGASEPPVYELWNNAWLPFTAEVAIASWQSLAWTQDHNDCTLYCDGVASGTQTSPTAITTTNLGFRPSPSHVYPNTLNGLMDEVRVRTSKLTPAWIATEYANQNDPASFYTVVVYEVSGTVLPNTVTYGTVTGQFVTAVLDGSDPDSSPDMAPIHGSVTFTLNPAGEFLKETSAKLVIIPQPITVALDDNGYFSVKLIATDSAGLNDSNSTYTVSINLVGFAARAVIITVPSGTTQDLSSLLPAPII